MDPVNKEFLIDLLTGLGSSRKGKKGEKEHPRSRGMASVVVTHDVDQAERVADYLYLLVEGRVEDQGAPETVLAEESGTVNLLRRFAAGELEETDHA